MSDNTASTIRETKQVADDKDTMSDTKSSGCIALFLRHAHGGRLYARLLASISCAKFFSNRDLQECVRQKCTDRDALAISVSEGSLRGLSGCLRGSNRVVLDFTACGIL